MYSKTNTEYGYSILGEKKADVKKISKNLVSSKKYQNKMKNEKKLKLKS